MVPTPARGSNNKFGKEKRKGKGNTCRRLERVCRLWFLSILENYIYNLQMVTSDGMTKCTYLVQKFRLHT